MDMENGLAPEKVREFRKIGNEIVSNILCEEFDEAISQIRAVGEDLKLVIASTIWVQGMNLLHQAAKTGNVDLVECILDTRCFDIDARDKGGTTPLFFAAGAGHLDVAKLLLARGADVEARRSTLKSGGGAAPTALVSSMIFKHEAVALYLIERGAATGPYVSDAGGRSLVAIAIDGDLAAVFEKLCLRKYFNDDWTGAMATVARSGPEKIMDFCFGFPPLSETVSGDKVSPAVRHFWCDRAKHKILSWRAGREIEAAVGSGASGIAQRRNAAPSL